MALGIGQLVPGYTVDGFILADIDVVGIFGNFKIGAIGDIGIILVLTGGGDNNLADLFGLGDGLF